jgi:hypothetical protein
VTFWPVGDAWQQIAIDAEGLDAFRHHHADCECPWCVPGELSFPFPMWCQLELL